MPRLWIVVLPWAFALFAFSVNAERFILPHNLPNPLGSVPPIVGILICCSLLDEHRLSDHGKSVRTMREGTVQMKQVDKRGSPSVISCGYDPVSTVLAF